MKDSLTACTRCPRACNANRAEGHSGVCGVSGKSIYVARAALHMWEEPCISGDTGSGTVFFYGCPLRCIYCQNYRIAHISSEKELGRLLSSEHEIKGEIITGRAVTVEELAAVFLEMQKMKAKNINLVTPTHYTPEIIEAVLVAKERGLHLPIVYNCSGYERVETLSSLEGIVDIYLTDFKYMDASLAKRFSNAEDYPEVAKLALEEMVRQMRNSRKGAVEVENPVLDEMVLQMRSSRKGAAEVENPVLDEMVLQMRNHKNSDKDVTNQTPDTMILQRINCENSAEEVKKEDLNIFDEQGIMQKGIIVRHLLLPNHVKNAKAVVEYVYETYGDQVYISLMNQYTPLPQVENIPELNRRVTKREYESLIDYAVSLGVVNGFIQEGETAKESFIPEFE